MDITTFGRSGKFCIALIQLSLATKAVLACSHRRSLQLLYTVGGNQARLDARSEFDFRRGGVEAGRAQSCRRGRMQR